MEVLHVPITLDEALQEIQTTLSEIKEKKKYYEGLLKKLNFSDSLHLKIILRVLDFVNLAYQELDYKMKHKLIPEDLD